MYRLSVYTVVYLVAVTTSGVALAVAWRRRKAPGGWWLTLTLATAIIWVLADAVEASALTLAEHAFWSSVAGAGAYPISVFLLLFALEYSGRPRMRPVAVAALLVVPTIAIAAAFTNSWHHLIWTGYIASVTWPTLIVYQHGWFYWVATGYSFVLVATAGATLIAFAVRNRDLYRYQSATALAAVAIPLSAVVIYDARPALLGGIDPSVTFSLAAALLTVSMLQFKLLDLAPVAREMLVERFDDAVLVLDVERRVLDANAKARALFGIVGNHWVGEHAAQAFADWPTVATFVEDSDEAAYARIVSPKGRHFSVKNDVVRDGSGRPTGSVVVLRDLTDFVQTAEALEEANRRLHDRIAEIEVLQDELREQAMRDSLTGLYNRRYLVETLERELGRARRESYPVSLIMLDADHFKLVNDTHGHAAGDQVMRFLGAELRAQVRPGDIACRYGGDEFVLVLPNTAVAHAAHRAQEWLAAVRESSVHWMAWAEPTTLSIGLAEFPTHGATPEEVMAAADGAVYEAKAAGGDCAVVAPSGLGSDV